MLKIIINRLLLVIVMSILLGLGWIIYTVIDISQEQERNGQAWCKNIMDQYESDPKKILSTYSHLSPREGYPIHLREQSNNGQYLAFFIMEDGDYRCSYTQATGLFPWRHEYSSKTEKWEVFD